MINKNYLLFSGLLTAVFLVLGVTGLVSANSGVNESDAYTIKPEKVLEMKKLETKVTLNINQAGEVQFSGAKFVSLNGSVINITVSGLPLAISTDSNTQISGVSGLSGMAVGDILSGKGSINQSTGVITALLIKDESQQTQRITDLENQIKSLLEQLKKMQAEFKNLR